MKSFRIAASLLLAAGIAGTTLLAQGVINRTIQPKKTVTQVGNLKLTPGVFATDFTANATTYNAKNAYLLAYMAVAVYPDYTAVLNNQPKEGRYFDRLNRNENNFYEEEFKRILGKHFVGSDGKAAEIEFHTTAANDPDGYDAEAITVENNELFLIIVRGTDRVARHAKGSAGYHAWEWIKTNFNAVPIDPGLGNSKIRVLGGMWSSLRTIRESLKDKAQAAANAGKKIWITGHSLGAGQAQMLAAFFAHRNIPVQGMYGFAAPQVGNQEFVDLVNSKYPRGRFLRFDFAQDPVTMIAPYILGFRRAGQRVFYRDIKTAEKFADDRSFIEGAAGLMNLGISIPADMIAAAASGNTKNLGFTFDSRGNSNLCNHHQGWYVNAAYNDVPAAQRSTLPTPFPLPVASDMMCNPDMIALGKDEDAQQDAGEAVGEVIETIAFNARELFENFVGSAIPEGDYFIRCNKGKKYLDISGSCMNEDGCKAQLWDLGASRNNNVFRVRKEGPSYRITLASNGKALEVHGMERFNDGGRIQTWTSNFVGGVNANQKWFIYSFKKVGNKFYCLLVNAASMKVLDAYNKETNKNGGRVQIYKSVSNDQTQVWILEPAN